VASPATGWLDAPDVTLAVLDSRFTGARQGSGRVTAHLVEVTARRRHAAPEEVRRWLWLPGEDGELGLAAEEPSSSSGTPDLLRTGTSGARARREHGHAGTDGM